MAFLTGSTFPLSLIRRSVRIEPVTLEAYRRHLFLETWSSFWGHQNTLSCANALTGVDLTPRIERPAVILNRDGFPTLNGIEYRDCWVLSPEYRPGFRPAIGQEVQASDILGWQVLRIQWDN